jgi:urease accessory protein
MQTRISLSPNSRFIGWEMLCLGRPASGEKYTLGHCRQQFSIWRDDRPLIIENTRLHGSSPVLNETWGLQGATVMGTLLAVGADQSLVEAVRVADIEIDDGLMTVSLVNDVLICRALAKQAEEVRQAFIKAWQVIRPALIGCESCPPRIWFT